MSIFFPGVAVQPSFASLSYLTENPKRSQNRVEVSVNNKTVSLIQIETHGKMYVKLLDDGHTV